MARAALVLKKGTSPGRATRTQLGIGDEDIVGVPLAVGVFEGVVVEVVDDVGIPEADCVVFAVGVSDDVPVPLCVGVSKADCVVLAVGVSDDVPVPLCVGVSEADSVVLAVPVEVLLCVGVFEADCVVLAVGVSDDVPVPLCVGVSEAEPGEDEPSAQ